MAELRGATPPSGRALNELCEAVSGFTRGEIFRACEVLKTTPFDPYAPRVITELEVVKACKKAGEDKAEESKYCDRCIEGHIRLGKEVALCECVCKDCEGRGFRMLTIDGRRWKPGMKKDRYAQRCPCMRKAVTA